MAKRPALVTQQEIESAILLLRGEKVLLDSDLARFYGVSTKALNQAVKRNQGRFPGDFMFRLTAKETSTLNRSQFVTGSQKHRDPRYPPFAFTEHGVAMLASVLRSERAVQVNIEIVRTFVRLRRLLAANADLARRLDEVESRLGNHDEQFVQLIRAIRELMQPVTTQRRRPIGFHQPADKRSTTARSKTRGAKTSAKR
jgi:hypothetical protein